MSATRRNFAGQSMRARERGAALFIALVALIFMVLGGIALVRSVDTANLIAGNFAFKQGALNTSDQGIEAALTLLNGTIVSTSLEANYPAGCSATAPTTCRYFALQQADVLPTGAPDGIPDPIGTWASVPCIYSASSVPSHCPSATSTASTAMPTGYSYQYVIDRLCTGTLPITNITKDCYSGTQIGGGSKRAGATVFTAAQEVYYRVTVRVVGPRNTTTIVQALLAR